MPVTTPKADCRTHALAWQGWRIDVPADWNPVRINGDERNGSILLADLRDARLGVRWTTPRRKDRPDALTGRAMQEAVGALAAAEAVMMGRPGFDAARLYLDPSPPGRDVFVAWSGASGRVIEVIHYATRRSDAFAAVRLPTLVDETSDEREWAVFDFAFRAPADCRVRWFRFNAGDISVALERRGRRGLTVLRQVSPATLALGRRSLDHWLAGQSPADRRLYRPRGPAEPASIGPHDALRLRLRRRPHLWWLWRADAVQVALACHDTFRDRLLLGRSGDEVFLRELLATVLRRSAGEL